MTRRRRETNLRGRRLGEFVVEDKIGAGGFGDVYRATQPILDRQAVVKILHTNLRATSEATDRFLREARLASRLDHPYAAHTYAFGAEADGTLWIAMELVRGSTLSSYMRTHGPMPLEKFVPLLERICEVVHTAHTQKIVHRDLKPANVMVVSRAGRLLPKLLDFGIAKSMLVNPLPPAQIVEDEPDVHPTDPTLGADESIDDTMAVSADGALVRGDGATLLPGSSKLEPREASPRQSVDVEPIALPRSTQRLESATEPTQAASPTGDSSSASSQLTGYGAMMGSPHYMAPEQWADAASAGPPADLYALGVLAYEALTGSPPFSGDFSKLHAEHRSAPIPPVPDSLPSTLDEVFKRALAKSPDDRYSDALELAAAFRDAAGLSNQRRPLPQLEETIRERYLGDAPQPLAEAVASLEGARDPRQARDALWVVADSLACYVALAAVAARARWTSGDPPPGVTSALRELGTTTPGAEDWLKIGQALVESAASQPDLHPVPELVMFLCDEHGARGDGVEKFATLAAHRESLADPNATDEVIRERLGAALAALSALLRAAEFVCNYPVAIPGDQDTADLWVGLRRPRRTAISLPEVAVEVGQPILVDWDGNPVVSLHPLVQIAPPAPGAPPEMFFYAGRDKRGAKLAAPPLAFVRHEPMVHEWLRRQLATTLDTLPSPSDDETPYLGLQPFSTADADRFLGRERQVEGVVNRLRVQPLLAIVGQSGAGKSSFVQAGVVPRLEGWRVITMRPGAAPMSTLAAHVGAAERLADDPASLGEILRESASERPVILIVDQLEELFTLCDDADERVAFVTAIASAARAAEDPVRVVLTLRDDFWVQLESLASLRERLARGVVLLTTPARDDLERIVREPARRAGYTFEDSELPMRMVAEVEGQPGALALISFTAATLWERRDRHFKRIPSQAYEAIGGVGGALAQHAESLRESLPAEQRNLLRNIFSHLVTAEGTRAVLSRAELLELSGRGSTAEGVIETLIDGRLLVASESEDGEHHIEIIHEALLSAWPRLVEWRRDDAEGARLRDQLRTSARQWDARGRPRALLWRDELLVDLRRWRAKEPDLTSLESAFADASVADAARGKRLRRRVVIAALTLLSAGVVLLLVLNSRVEEQRVAAEKQRLVAEDQRLLAQTNLVKLYEENGRQALLARDYFRAAVLLSAAFSQGGASADTPALRFMLAQALRPMRSPPIVVDHGEPITWVSFSPDGKRVATSGIAARQPKVWSSATGELLYALPAQTSNVRMTAFDRAGRRLATAGTDNVARLWSADTGAPIAELDHGAPVRWVAFDPSGEHLATAGADGSAKIWRLADKSVVNTLPGTTAIEILVWSPSGLRLATATTNGTAVVWNARTGARVQTLEGHSWRVFRLLYPTEDTVITAAFDGVARRWNPDTGTSEVLARHAAHIWDTAVDPRGELVATVSGDGMLKLVTLSGTPVASTRAHRGSAFSVSFSSDGERLLTTSFDGTARVWDRSGMLVGVLAGQAAPFYRGQFGPTDDRIAVASIDGKLRLWSRVAEPPIRVLPKHDAPLRSLDFSFDGTLLVSAAGDGAVRVIDTETRQQLAELKTSGPPTIAVALADKLVAVSHNVDLTVRRYSGEITARQKLEAPIWDAVVSADGEFLTTVSTRLQATIWKVPELETVHVMPARWARWAPDGQLVTATETGVVKWDPSSKRETSTIETGPTRWGHPCADGGVLSIDNGNGVARWSAAGERLESRRLKSHYVVGAIADCSRAAVFGDSGLPTLVDLESGRALDFLEIAAKKFSYIDITPDARRIAIAEHDRVLYWELDRIAETPDEIAELVRCTVPYKVVGANLESASLGTCAP